jgi:hypothetical protein
MGTSVFRIPRLGLPTVNATGSSTAGITLGVLAYALFSVHDAVIKWLVADLPAHEVLFVRSTGILAAAAIIGRRRLLERAVATPLKARCCSAASSPSPAGFATTLLPAGSRCHSSCVSITQRR